ncbi:MAG: type II secretion system major pseudopilin GspG [Planctomycetota bacterium]
MFYKTHSKTNDSKQQTSGSRQRSRKNFRGFRGRGGFSLIEVMVVVVIIALLAGAVGFSVSGYTDRGRKTKAKADLATIAGAIKSYYGDHGRYPDPSGGIGVLVPDYLEQTVADPWGGAYQYELPGAEGPFDVICFGADGREGGEGIEADFTNWSQPEQP